MGYDNYYRHGYVGFARANDCHCDLCEDAYARQEVRGQSLPFAPMLAFEPKPQYGRDGKMYGGMAVFPPVYRRAWIRAKSEGRVSVMAADDLCFEILRRHPVEVFGPLWFEDVSA